MSSSKNITRRHSSRARRLGLTVKTDGEAVLTVPRWAGESDISRFLADSAAWLDRQIARVARYKDDTFLPRSRQEYLSRREDARRLVLGILSKFGQQYEYRWRRVAIKDLRRNWGSCSERSNLNFSWKLVLLPIRLAEYVVFHELCHLDAFDHSQRFWALVAREFPDHRAIRVALRRYHQ